jgi:hypothetical protein
VPLLGQLRAALPGVFGEKARDLYTEGNHYMNNKAGIGAHGDTLRKKVICCSLDAAMTLRFFWRFPKVSSKHGPSTTPMDFTITAGSLYMTSAKATGWDWKKSSLYRLVHCAGAHKYLRATSTTTTTITDKRKNKAEKEDDDGNPRAKRSKRVA